MEINNKNVGQKIKKIRINQGLNQEEFGILIDKAHKSLVSKWEKGMSMPNKSRLLLIANMADLTVDELVFENLELFYYDNFNQVLSQYAENEESLSLQTIKSADVNQLFNRWLNQYKNVFSYDDETEIKNTQQDFIESYLQNLRKIPSTSSHNLIGIIKEKISAARNELPNIHGEQHETEADAYKRIDTILTNAIAEIEEVESILE